MTSSVIGSHPYGRCTFWQYMPTTKYFVNTVDGRQSNIRQFINFQTGVIYLARCTTPKLYVGKTTQKQKQRILKHLLTQGPIPHYQDT